MATTWRALLASVLLYLAYVVARTLGVGGEAGPGWHQRHGLVGALVAALALSVPFAYFLGTGFWVKYFADSAGAGPDWERRHKQWMKDRGYPLMYGSALAVLAAGITGGLADTGRLAPAWHVAAVVVVLLLMTGALVLVPPMMRRNAALMDELAARHRVPEPGTDEAAALRARMDAESVPPLFQLGRILVYLGIQVLLVWLYLRFGTETWRDTPIAPFGVPAIALVTLGKHLHDRHHPESPRGPGGAWSGALLLGGASAALVLLLARLP